MQESHSEKDILNRSCNVFTIRGAFCGDKCFPSLNQYIAELGRNPRCGAKYKKQYVMIATNAIRRDMGRFKTLYCIIPLQSREKALGVISETYLRWQISLSRTRLEIAG